jgi:uncharacterized protein
MIRGFALFGVLLVNMYGFGADSIAWDAPADQIAFAIMHIFFESKSWTLFCMLFGFGFAVQMQRAAARGLPILPTYLRRLAALFAFGAVHTLLYDGDILMLYAELGLVLLVVRRLPTRMLLLMAVGLMLVFPLAHIATPERQPAGMEEIEGVSDARAQLELDRRTHEYVTGSMAEVVVYNASAIPANPLEDFNWADSGLTAFAMFLLGFSIGRSGVLRDIPGRVATIARVRSLGLGLGLAAMAAERVLAATAGYAVFRPQRSGLVVQLTGDLLFAFGATALALGYAATLVLAAQTPRGRTALAPLAGVGRLALSVYLTQTLIFTTLFYGYGFGQAYRLGPVGVTAWAVVIFAVQVVACEWWVKRFRFGPMEWLWRSLTYLKWQPLRRRT